MSWSTHLFWSRDRLHLRDGEQSEWEVLAASSYATRSLLLRITLLCTGWNLVSSINGRGKRRQKGKVSWVKQRRKPGRQTEEWEIKERGSKKTAEEGNMRAPFMLVVRSFRRNGQALRQLEVCVVPSLPIWAQPSGMQLFCEWVWWRDAAQVWTGMLKHYYS